MSTESSQFETVSCGGVPCLYVPHCEIDALIERLPEDFMPVAEVLKVLARYVQPSLDGANLPDHSLYDQAGFPVETTHLSGQEQFSLDEKIALQLCAMLGSAFPLAALHNLEVSRLGCVAMRSPDGQAAPEDLGAPDVDLDFEIWDDLSD